MKSKWKYVIIIASIALVAGLGTLFVNLGMDWFEGLNKPSEFVPSAVIPIMWSIIYLSFAVILCVWVNNTKLPTSTLVLLIINGVLNVVWCLLFFTLNSTLLGLIAIIVNLIFAIILIIDTWRRVNVFGYILAIYPLWLCLATCLNLSTWILN